MQIDALDLTLWAKRGNPVFCYQTNFWIATPLRSSQRRFNPRFPYINQGELT
jgi:hypothetical protein